MSEAMIYCASRVDWRYNERRPAMAQIARLREWYGDRFYYVEIAEETDYAAGLIGLWDRPGDIVNIEHDMAPSVPMIEGLLACPHETCSQVYWLSPASTGRVQPGLAARVGYDTTEWRSIQLGETFAAQSGIGLVKLSEAWRWRVGPIDLARWDHVEFEIHRKLGRQGWHLHGPPCPHYHGFINPEQGDERAHYEALDWPDRERVGRTWEVTRAEYGSRPA